MDPVVRVRCACGWETTGAEAEVVTATREHGRRLHNMVPTRDEVLAMVVGDGTPPGDSGASRRFPPAR